MRKRHLGLALVGPFVAALLLGLALGDDDRYAPAFGRKDDPKFEQSYVYTRAELGHYLLTPPTPKIPLGFAVEGVDHPDASILTNYPPFNQKTNEESLFLKFVGSRAFNPAIIEVPVYVSTKRYLVLFNIIRPLCGTT